MIQAEKAQQRLAWLTDLEIMSIKVIRQFAGNLDMESMAQCLTKEMNDTRDKKLEGHIMHSNYLIAMKCTKSQR